MSMETTPNQENQPPKTPESAPKRESLWEHLIQSHGFGKRTPEQIPEGMPTENLEIQPLEMEDIPEQKLEPEFHTDQLAALPTKQIKWNKGRFKEGMEITAGSVQLLVLGTLYGAVWLDGKLLHYALKKIDPGFVKDTDKHYDNIMKWWRRMRRTETRPQQSRQEREKRQADLPRRTRKEELERKKLDGAITPEEDEELTNITAEDEADQQAANEAEQQRRRDAEAAAAGAGTPPTTPPTTPEPGETQDEAEQRVRQQQALQMLADIDIAVLYGFENQPAQVRQQMEAAFLRRILSGAKRDLMARLPDEEKRKEFEDLFNKRVPSKELNEFLNTHIPDHQAILNDHALRLKNAELQRAERQQQRRGRPRT